MTATTTPATPGSVEGLLPETTLTGGDTTKATTAAADAAAVAARDAAATEAPKGDSPEIGRASARAKAGFNSKKSKEELIRLGRDLALEKVRLEEELATLRGGKGAEGAAVTPEVKVDPAALVPVLATLARIAGGFLGAMRGDHWEFSEKEQLELASASAPVVARQAPNLGEDKLELFFLLVTVAGLAIPRLKQDRELREAQDTRTAAERRVA